jgi:hypothetical protein
LPHINPRLFHLLRRWNRLSSLQFFQFIQFIQKSKAFLTIFDLSKNRRFFEDSFAFLFFLAPSQKTFGFIKKNNVFFEEAPSQKTSGFLKNLWFLKKHLWCECECFKNLRFLKKDRPLVLSSLQKALLYQKSKIFEDNPSKSFAFWQPAFCQKTVGFLKNRRFLKKGEGFDIKDFWSPIGASLIKKNYVFFERMDGYQKPPCLSLKIKDYQKKLRFLSILQKTKGFLTNQR